MLPNLFLKDQLFSQYQPQFGANIPTPNMLQNMMGMDFMENTKALGRAQANIQANTSIDSLLHVHRRKLQRRAANRKSAQLSRARKKAHLEELTQENARLQQLVDVLDSQPELIFCINARGDITYISERTVNFVNINNSTDGGEEDPSHISQILAKESAESVLKTIQEIMKVSPPKSALAESSMLFSAKVVEFQDSFGHPLVGYMRCARVNRRAIPVEETTEDMYADPPTPTPTGGQAKKAKLKHDIDEQELKRLAAALPLYANAAANGMQVSNLGVEEWNLTNFKMLTDCVSNLADRHDQSVRETVGGAERHPSGDGGGQSSTAAEGVSSSALSAPGTVAVADPEADSEFVCVIRTSDSYFARYSTRSDLYMFVSTPLSAASMEAHDQKGGRGLGRHSAQSVSTGSSSSGAQDTTTGASNSNGSSAQHLKEHLKEQRKRGINSLDKSSGSESHGSNNSLTADSNEKASGSSGSGSGEQKCSSGKGSTDSGSDDNRGESFP